MGDWFIHILIHRLRIGWVAGWRCVAARFAALQHCFASSPQRDLDQSVPHSGEPTAALAIEWEKCCTPLPDGNDMILVCMFPDGGGHDQSTPHSARTWCAAMAANG